MMILALALSLLVTVPALVLGPAEGRQERSPPPALYLLFRGNAQSMEVIRAVQKKHAYRKIPKVPKRHRVQLYDSDGRVLASVPVDLSGFCLDPSHKDDPPHVQGDVIRPHKVQTIVVVPGDAKLVRIGFEQEVTARDRKSWHELGRCEEKELRRLIREGQPR
jgi:hypothetical protein